jgi:LysM repeat protein
VDPRTRRELTRYGAPAAFLAAVTIAVILIKAGLSGSSDSVTTVGQVPTTTNAPAKTSTKIVLTAPQAVTTTPTTAATTATTTPGAVYYTVQEGDTLGSIATKYDTSVDELTSLNPGVDPNEMHIGQRIRVK